MDPAKQDPVFQDFKRRRRGVTIRKRSLHSTSSVRAARRDEGRQGTSARKRCREPRPIRCRASPIEGTELGVSTTFAGAQTLATGALAVSGEDAPRPRASSDRSNGASCARGDHPPTCTRASHGRGCACRAPTALFNSIDSRPLRRLAREACRRNAGSSLHSVCPTQGTRSDLEDNSGGPIRPKCPKPKSSALANCARKRRHACE